MQAGVLPSDPAHFLKGLVGLKESKRCMDALTWLGMFGDEESPELVKGASLMEAFCARLQKKLYYQPHVCKRSSMRLFKCILFFCITSVIQGKRLHM